MLCCLLIAFAATTAAYSPALRSPVAPRSPVGASVRMAADGEERIPYVRGGESPGQAWASYKRRLAQPTPVDEEKPALSMETLKKYGVAGTVAYVLTELAFWAVAFPVASASFYNLNGHWPDVLGDGDDRLAVLGFVFAGANIARLAVPLRFGAAFALAPWVDENIIARLPKLGGAGAAEEE